MFMEPDHESRFFTHKHTRIRAEGAVRDQTPLRQQLDRYVLRPRMCWWALSPHLGAPVPPSGNWVLKDESSGDWTLRAPRTRGSGNGRRTRDVHQAPELGRCRREPPAAARRPGGPGALTLVMPLTEEVMILTVSMVTLWTIFSSRSLW